MSGDASIHVTPVAPYSVPVVVVDYDERWPAQFAEERSLIAGALGDTLVSIEHTGSTSVPGLPAKPIIDITIEVPDSAAEPSYLLALQGIGLELRIREPKWFEHRLLCSRTGSSATADGRPASYSVNLHVFSAGCDEVRKMVAFRDWLSTHPADRARYGAEKRRLAQQRWKYVQDYADAKTGVIAEILGRAWPES